MFSSRLPRPKTTVKAKVKDLSCKAKDLCPKDKAKDLHFGFKNQGQGLTSLFIVQFQISGRFYAPLGVIHTYMKIYKVPRS